MTRVPCQVSRSLVNPAHHRLKRILISLPVIKFNGLRHPKKNRRELLAPPLPTKAACDTTYEPPARNTTSRSVRSPTRRRPPSLPLPPPSAFDLHPTPHLHVAMAAVFAPAAAAAPSRFMTVLRSFFPATSAAVAASPIAIGLISLPQLFPGLFESVLRAVPKKKTSHSKKRMRQLAGKALKDVDALNRCSACGNIKRAHLLCAHCVRNIQDMWKGKNRQHPEAGDF